jgi:cytochrome c biogenesis protein
MKEPMPKTQGKDISTYSLIFDLFRSVKLTIFLLILLALVSIIGTVIMQNATNEQYVQRYGETLYELLDFFSLFDMYHSWWFSAILLLLVLNLLACSIHRLPGIWSQMVRGAGPNGLEDSMVRTLPYVEKVRGHGRTSELEDQIRAKVKEWHKSVTRIETETAVTLFSEKGRFSRLGVPISHLSILVILVGGLMGSLFGFRAFVNILEGETADRVFVRAAKGDVPYPLSFGLRLDDFQMSYYDLPRPEKLVKEYASVVSVMESGKEVLKQTVRVNHPLHYGGIAFYQSSYGALHEVSVGVQWKDRKEKGLVKAFEGDTVPVPNSNAQIRILRYAHEVHNSGEGVQVALFKPNERPRAFWILKGAPESDQQRDGDFFLTLEGVSEKEYTGLQATKDPGVWVVWTGCGLMILGFIVSFFFSHQKIWIRIPKEAGGEILIAGSTSKNRMNFEQKFQALVESFRRREKKA